MLLNSSPRPLFKTKRGLFCALKTETMGETKLYKYLDVKGGLLMLKYSTLQFTNATQLNDPFDCHPGLFDYSNVPNDKAKIWGKQIVEDVEKNHAERLRDDAWICSLSKVHDSLLMWSYYCGHKGVCIGLDREKIKLILSNTMNGIYLGARELEVQYKEIIEKPDSFRGDDFSKFEYQLSTKAKAWEHEKEVRFLLIDPTPAPRENPTHPSFVIMALPDNEKYNNVEEVDWREVRAYKIISGDCFDSLYLGVNIEKEDKEEIIKNARKRNPNIKIYQMKPDPEAFKLKEEEI